MNPFYVILASFPVLLLGAVAFFVLIVIGVHRGDRGELTSPSRNRLDAITRRVIGAGVRRENDGSEG